MALKDLRIGLPNLINKPVELTASLRNRGRRDRQLLLQFSQQGNDLCIQSQTKEDKRPEEVYTRLQIIKVIAQT